MTSNKSNHQPPPDDSPEDLDRWEDDGGTVHSDPLSPPARSRRLRGTEAVFVAIAVAIAHLVPFGGIFGRPLLGVNDCSAIAKSFSPLAAGILSIRILCRENRTLEDAMKSSKAIHLWPVEAIGALVLGVWCLPFVLPGHGIAEATIAAIGVTVSILVSAAIDRACGWAVVARDTASVLVIVFAFIWTQTLPHFQMATHGEEFLAAAAVGASSLYGWQTLFNAIMKAR